jgi:hypothetical protein
MEAPRSRSDYTGDEEKKCKGEKKQRRKALERTGDSRHENRAMEKSASLLPPGRLGMTGALEGSMG